MAPSLLAADFGDLNSELRSLAAAGSDLLHLDVMDGHFVPNITFGPFIVAAIDRGSDLPLDAHLMLERPDRFVAPFADAGADALTIHAESDCDIGATLADIDGRGVKPGLSLNPDTPVEVLLPYLEDLDLVLVMSVQPGFGGQKFRESAVAKIRELCRLRDENGWRYAISVDGGIDDRTGAVCRAAGADILVSGSWLVRSPDRAAAVEMLRGGG